jgi:hypothetical protein
MRGVRQAEGGMIDQRNWCIRCGALEEEVAGRDCTNPIWHLPHFLGEVPLPEKPQLVIRRQDGMD